jgi:hypothetical protein
MKMMESSKFFDDEEFETFVPQFRIDVVVRQFDNEAVAWSPLGGDPIYLSPLGALIWQLVDGTSSVGEFVSDVNEVVGIPASVARDQLRSVLTHMNNAGLLTTSTNNRPTDEMPTVFSAPPDT